PTGDIAWHPYTTLWGTTVPAPPTAADCPLRFPGQYHDPETGHHYNYFRHYDSTLGRYQSADQAGLICEANLFGYVENPLHWTDPLGLAPYRNVRMFHYTDQNGYNGISNVITDERGNKFMRFRADKANPRDRVDRAIYFTPKSPAEIERFKSVLGITN